MDALIDSHCHFDVDAFDDDRDAVHARARQAGVIHQIVPAIDRAGWDRLGAVCAGHLDLHPAWGLHPVFLDAHVPEDLEHLEARLHADRPVAVGECGLDYFIDGLDRDLQAMYFDRQLALARAHDLPVIVHARRAVDAVIAALRRHTGIRGVVHSFSGSPEQAAQLWSLGFHIGIGGPVTYERARRLHRVVAALPPEQLLLETDAPDQPDSAHRGQRNEPARIRRVCEVVAGLRGESIREVANRTTANAARLFGLPLP